MKSPSDLKRGRFFVSYLARMKNPGLAGVENLRRMVAAIPLTAPVTPSRYPDA